MPPALSHVFLLPIQHKRKCIPPHFSIATEILSPTPLSYLLKDTLWGDKLGAQRNDTPRQAHHATEDGNLLKPAVPVKQRTVDRRVNQHRKRGNPHAHPHIGPEGLLADGVVAIEGDMVGKAMDWGCFLWGRGVELVKNVDECL